MKKEAEKIVLYSDPEAAQLKTITGWVSRDGRYFGKDEHSARICGSTHKLCKCCSNIAKAPYTVCDDCRRIIWLETYSKYEFKEWDGKECLYCYNSDQYFWDEDSIAYYCEENDVLPEDLQLVICEPQHFYGVSADYWEDILPEDEEELPKELSDVVKALNKVIETLKPASWIPSKIRTEYIDEDLTKEIINNREM